MTAMQDLLDPEVPFNHRLLTNDVQKTLIQLNAINFDSVHELITNAAFSIHEHDPDTSDEHVKDLKGMLENVIKQHHRLDNHKEALVELASELNDHSYQQLCIPDYDWVTPLANKIHRISRSRQASQNHQLQRRIDAFQEEIAGCDDHADGMDVDGDDDIIIEKEVAYDKCPVTQGPLTDAMKSTKCGHIYSKAGIESLLSRRSTMPCPVSGCKQNISRDCLRRNNRSAFQQR